VNVPIDFVGLAVLLIFAVLIGVFSARATRRRATPPVLRRVEAYHHLPETVGQAVETGRRLQISLGTGTLGQASTAATLAGIAVLDQISAAAAISDKPPIVTSADGGSMLLAQDTLRNVYARQNALGRYDAFSAQVPGLTPGSFGAAQTTLQKDEAVAGTLLIGSIGTEAVLLTEAGQRLGVTTLAGSDNLAGQAVLFATADHPIIGEDLFAGGAYVGGTPAHIGSLQAQDVVRLLIGAAVILGVVLRTVSDLPRLFGIGS
jgi:hypothetical protein